MREFPKDLDNVYMYLRKSRADIEAEMRGEGETLSKHKKALLELAHKNRYNIKQIFEEVVSGERIEYRPEMIKLLNDVEDGKCTAVLCMDIDRLGRGDMRDQGTIIAAFKESKTLIITPNKCYDLEDEFDEEYSEFEAFMARRELKMITKRMQRGRVASVKDGKYIGAVAPYGYDIGDNLILVPNDKADIVRMMFSWYVNEKIGTNRIANRLNEMKIKSPRGNLWSNYTVNAILKNEVYIGKMQWKKTFKDKKKKIQHFRPREEWISVEGKHTPLVDPDMYEKTQHIMKNKTKVPNRADLKIANPLSGIVYCEKCGKAMVRRPYSKQQPHMICANTHCKTKSTRFDYVEKEVITQLENWLLEYQVNVNMDQIEKELQGMNKTPIVVPESIINELENELKDLEKQQNNLHDFLERGIYDVDTYLKRNKNIVARINETKEALDSAKYEIEQQKKKEQAKTDLLPKIGHVIEAYKQTDDVEKKNNLLKQVIKRIYYKKEKNQVGNDFSLDFVIYLPD